MIMNERLSRCRWNRESYLPLPQSTLSNQSHSKHFGIGWFFYFHSANQNDNRSIEMTCFVFQGRFMTKNGESENLAPVEDAAEQPRGQVRPSGGGILGAGSWAEWRH